MEMQVRSYCRLRPISDSSLQSYIRRFFEWVWTPSARGWSCGFSDRPREIDHLVHRHPTDSIHHPASSIQRPRSSPTPVASAIHPRARCIIVRPHRLAPTSSTCPGQAAVCARARVLPLVFTCTHIHALAYKRIYAYVYIDRYRYAHMCVYIRIHTYTDIQCWF